MSADFIFQAAALIYANFIHFVEVFLDASIMSIVFENEKYCDNTYLYFPARKYFQFLQVHFVAILLVFTVSKSTSLRVFFTMVVLERYSHYVNYLHP